MTQQPSIGRMVIYTIPNGSPPLCSQREFPAVITHAWPGSDIVNLTVFVDGDPIWMRVTDVAEGPLQQGNHWTWPPRV